MKVNELFESKVFTEITPEFKKHLVDEAKIFVKKLKSLSNDERVQSVKVFGGLHCDKDHPESEIYDLENFNKFGVNASHKPLSARVKLKSGQEVDMSGSFWFDKGKILPYILSNVSTKNRSAPKAVTKKSDGDLSTMLDAFLKWYDTRYGDRR
jgi:hypothetical protein